MIHNNSSATTTHLSHTFYIFTSKSPQHHLIFLFFNHTSTHQPMLQMFEFWSFNINKIKLGLGPNATPSSSSSSGGRDGADRRRSTLAPLPNGTTTLAPPHHPSPSPSPLSLYPPPLGHSNQNLYQNCAAAAVVPGNVSAVCVCVCSVHRLLNFRTSAITSRSFAVFVCDFVCPGNAAVFFSF